MIKSSYSIIKIGITICLMFYIMGCSKDDEAPCFYGDIDDLKLNEVQIITSHNSYRKKTNPFIFNSLNAWTGLFPEDANPLNEWDYDHIPIVDQLNNYKIRGLEIDIYRDPEGGKFYNRYGHILTALPVESNESDLLNPGLKVLHIPDFDYKTHHLTFIDALSTIKNWSDENQNHFPLFIFIEPKEITLGNFIPLPQLSEALEFNGLGFKTVEDEIKSVFLDDNQIITPNNIKGSYSTVKEAILTEGWPTINESRGKIVFILIASDKEKNAYLNDYLPNEDKMIFLFGEEIGGEEVFYAINNPINNTEKIKYLVNQGFIVRTRADSGTKEARNGDYKPFSLGLKSGAQLITTDYYRPDPRHETSNKWTDYSVNFGPNVFGVINHEIGKKNQKGCLLTE